MNNPMKATTKDDPSNGYETIASTFMKQREQSNIGIATVRAWANSLPSGASILDLGCGHGVPVAKVLMDNGFSVYGVDGAASLVAEFRHRFPHAHVVCETVEDSSFFSRTFDGIVAVGLMFLLPARVQRDLIRKTAWALNSGGRFLFTSPTQVCRWMDVLTNRPSFSLGREEYKSLLADVGLRLIAEYRDEGDNHYYDACKL